MIQASNIRLPGVYFLPPPRARGLRLPPLDVAAFVGYAERGPLHLPVACEDLATFRAVFGADLALARERGGATQYANLHTSVETFFANGGRRCYVVRVAGERATRTRLRLPSIVALDTQDATGPQPTFNQSEMPRQVALLAASEGRWAGSLSLATRLQSTPLPIAAFSLGAGTGAQELIWETGGAPQAIQPGELLRLTLDDGRQWLYAIGDILRPAEPKPSEPLRLVARGSWQVVLPAHPPPQQPVEKVFRLRPYVPGQAETYQPERLHVMCELTTSGDSFRLDFIQELQPGLAGTIERGDVIRIHLTDNTVYLLNVADADTPPAASASPDILRRVTTPALLALPATTVPTFSPAGLRRVERLRFDLLLWEGKDRRPTISELAFNTGHPRYWGDAVLFESSKLPLPQASGFSSTQAQGSAEVSQAARNAALYRLFREGTRVDDPRLGVFDTAALAGLLAPVEANTLTYLPLDMLLVVGEDDPVGPLSDDDVGSDGLDNFNPAVFVDPFLTQNDSAQSPPITNLQTVSADALAGAAFDRYYVQNRRLRGLHSLFFIDEVALVSVCDAVHREWERVEPVIGSPTVSPPIESPPPPPDLSEFHDCAEVYAPPDAERHSFDAADVATESLLPELKPLEDFSTEALISIQQALLNFCQGRRDVVGILTLPAHFEKRQCIEWQEDFRDRLGLPRRLSTFNDVRDIADLSYVAVYHPWLLVADERATDRLRVVPIDGAVCGQIAARERERQVWVAPANMPLQGVLGLLPVINTADWADLFELQFNLARPEPRDFRVMSAHTLADERIWLQVSVRRLMILLRKVAVERGMDFVFEGNHERFREGVRMMLNGILQFMFERGAFAGRTAEESYVVTTDASVNTPQSVDAGRFIAQIQVAPSQPLEFITVTLIRIGEDLLQAREA